MRWRTGSCCRRSLPEAFRDCHVQRLGAFFRAHRDALIALAPPERRDHPRVVLLTPGPLNETYFEHAYLARYLGLHARRGRRPDRPRQPRVHQDARRAAAGGRHPPAARRQLSAIRWSCAPIRRWAWPGWWKRCARATSRWRTRSAPALVETPAIAAFLPELCRRLLGEELLLSPAASWWCGHPDDLQYVLEHLDELVIKPSFPPATRQPVFGRMLSAEQKGSLRNCAARPSGALRRADARWRCRRRRYGTGTRSSRDRSCSACTCACDWRLGRRDARRTDARRRRRATSRSCRCSAEAAARTRGSCRTAR